MREYQSTSALDSARDCEAVGPTFAEKSAANVGFYRTVESRPGDCQHDSTAFITARTASQKRWLTAFFSSQRYCFLLKLYQCQPSPSRSPLECSLPC